MEVHREGSAPVFDTSVQFLLIFKGYDLGSNLLIYLLSELKKCENQDKNTECTLVQLAEAQ